MAWPASLKAWAIRWYFGVFISCIKQHWGYDSLCTARRKQAAEKKNDTPQASEETRQGRPLGVAFGRLICIPRSTSYTSEPEVTRLRIWLGVQTTGERQRVYSVRKIMSIALSTIKSLLAAFFPYVPAEWALKTGIFNCSNFCASRPAFTQDTLLKMAVGKFVTRGILLVTA